MPAPILFDLDGTLIATRRLYIESFVESLLPRLGRRLTEEEIFALHPRAEIRFLHQVAGEEAHASVLDRFFESYDRLHGSHFQGVYTGVDSFLRRLREAGHPMGIVTGKSRRGWEITSRHLDLGLFDVVVVDDDVREGKPDPEGILLALERMGAASHRERAVYLGDVPSDLDAAVAAGVHPVAVLWSKRPEEREAFAAAADRLGGSVVETPDDAAALLLNRRISNR